MQGVYDFADKVSGISAAGTYLELSPATGRKIELLTFRADLLAPGDGEVLEAKLNYCSTPPTAGTNLTVPRATEPETPAFDGLFRHTPTGMVAAGWNKWRSFPSVAGWSALLLPEERLLLPSGAAWTFELMNAISASDIIFSGTFRYI